MRSPHQKGVNKYGGGHAQTNQGQKQQGNALISVKWCHFMDRSVSLISQRQEPRPLLFFNCPCFKPQKKTTRLMAIPAAMYIIKYG